MLKSTLKSIVDKKGPNCLKDIQIINILSDCQAFEDHSFAKFILKTIIQEGIAEKLYNIIIKGTYSRTIGESIVGTLFSKYGIHMEFAIYVVNALLFALDQSELSLDMSSKDDSSHSEHNVDNHIIFSGISLIHPINEIRDYLVKRGFTPIKSSSYRITMRGGFCGINDVELIINGSPAGVTKNIIISFDDKTPSLYIDWCRELYELLRNKYGEPCIAIDPLNTVKNDFTYYIKNLLTYDTIIGNYDDVFRYEWRVIGGEIKFRWYGNFMHIYYIDTINTNLAEKYQQQFNKESI